MARGTGSSSSCALAILADDAQAHAARMAASHNAHRCRRKACMAQRKPLLTVPNMSSAAWMTLEFIS